MWAQPGSGMISSRAVERDEESPMPFEDVMSTVMGWVTATEALAAVGAELSLAQNGQTAPPEIAAALRAVSTAARAARSRRARSAAAGDHPRCHPHVRPPSQGPARRARPGGGLDVHGSGHPRRLGQGLGHGPDGDRGIAPGPRAGRLVPRRRNGRRAPGGRRRGHVAGRRTSSESTPGRRRSTGLGRTSCRPASISGSSCASRT